VILNDKESIELNIGFALIRLISKWLQVT